MSKRVVHRNSVMASNQLQIAVSEAADKAKLDGFDHCKWELIEKAYEMLMEWKQKEGPDATYRVLHEALCHKFVNRTDLADKICR